MILVERLNEAVFFEATEAGSKFVTLADRKTLQYRSDGDGIVLEGYSENAQGIELWFGQCRGKVLLAYST